MIDRFDGDNRFLSNFFGPVNGLDIYIDGDVVQAPTVEHGYQAIKAIYSDQYDAAREILAAATPGIAKRLGRTFRAVSHWDHLKVGEMENLLSTKFHPKLNAPLAGLLLATYEQFLVEGNTWGDTFWGVCNGNGRNVMGNLLMETRDRLRRR